ncbi:MAG TPA: NAD(P)-dependent alcohol dehydrogenase [Iamia sp.]|jgi:NADPH:quinone reductase-like Zn-dependent oxidoreductase|nr:NAD(P)-dependent alcohol dehydrogenase [Iamia sp.]
MTPITPDEVLVEVHAGAIAGHDRRPSRRALRRELAGRVRTVGSGVSGFAPGDEVFGWCAGPLAEQVVVPQDRLERAPANLTLEQAAVIPVAGTTALRAVRDAGRVRPGQQVLVIGASGGVGTFAVQIAKAFGATVTGVCSTTNTALVRSIGADHVVDYTIDDCTRTPDRYDVVIDLVGAPSLSGLRTALTASGTLVLVGGGGRRWLGAGALSPLVRHRLRPLGRRDRASDLAALRDLVEAGLVIPVVSAHYALAELPQAVRHFAPGHTRGTIAITL